MDWSGLCCFAIKSIVSLECSLHRRGKKTIAVLKASRAEMKKKSSVAFPSQSVAFPSSSATGGIGCVMKCLSRAKKGLRQRKRRGFSGGRSRNGEGRIEGTH